MQHSVVMRAQQRHILGVRLAALYPVLQVMTVDIPFAMTARERAAAITRVERSA
jgi:hypothetical protein